MGRLQQRQTRCTHRTLHYYALDELSAKLRETLHGPYRSFFLTMDCMKASTMDDADTHRCVLSRGHTLSSSSDGGYRRRRCGWCDSGRTYGGRAPQRQRLLKVAAIFKQWYPDRNTRFEFQCRHQQPAVGRTTPRGAEGDRPNYATSLAHHHRDDAVKTGPLRELDGTCISR